MSSGGRVRGQPAVLYRRFQLGVITTEHFLMDLTNKGKQLEIMYVFTQ